MKLAMVGSREYKNEAKIRRYLELCQERYGDALTVVSGGCPDGADFLARKVALELGIHYVEFPPKHRPWNQYCILSVSEYNQPYHVSNFFARNTQIAEYCEYLAAFTVAGKPCRGTMDTFRKAEKLGKKCFKYEDNL